MPSLACCRCAALLTTPSDCVQLAVVAPREVGGAERAWVCDAARPPAAGVSSVGEEQQRYHEALAALLRQLFLSRESDGGGSGGESGGGESGSGGEGPVPVGFAFTADAAKLSGWLIDVQADGAPLPLSLQSHCDLAAHLAITAQAAAEGWRLFEQGEAAGDSAAAASAVANADATADGAALARGGGGEAARLAAAIKAATVDVQQLAAEAGLGSRGEVPAAPLATPPHPALSHAILPPRAPGAVAPGGVRALAAARALQGGAMFRLGRAAAERDADGVRRHRCERLPARARRDAAGLGRARRGATAPQSVSVIRAF